MVSTGNRVCTTGCQLLPCWPLASSVPLPAPCPLEFTPSIFLILIGLSGVLNLLPLTRSSYHQLSRSSGAIYNLRLGTVLWAGSKWGLPGWAGMGLWVKVPCSWSCPDLTAQAFSEGNVLLLWPDWSVVKSRGTNRWYSPLAHKNSQCPQLSCSYCYCCLCFQQIKRLASQCPNDIAVK